jgi:hypothetical protein
VRFDRQTAIEILTRHGVTLSLAKTWRGAGRERV